MNKIIRAALTATFPGINIDAILEVINATQNPTGATEKLIGVFEEPVLKRHWKRGTDIKVLKGFQWNRSEDDQVEYNYESKSTTIRFLKREDAIKFDANTEAAISTDRLCDYLTTNGKYKAEGEYTDERKVVTSSTYSGSCSITTWLDYHYNEMTPAELYEEHMASSGTMI
jgi:hypothetical protein